MDNSRQLREKAELNATLNSQGWQVAMKIADQAVKAAEEAVWDCKDKEQRDDLVLKAQAAREFITLFHQTISQVRNVDIDNTPIDSFIEASY